MALYFIIAVSLLGLFHNSDCQTVTLEAPDDVVLGQSMTVTCRFTNGASSSNTVDNIEWSCSGASIGFPVVSPSCSVFGALPSEYSGMSITPSCGTNEYSLVFASVERTTVNKSWCCNVVLSPGPSPSVKSCDSPMLKCGDPTKATNGQVTFTTTTYQSEATYRCDSGYTIDGTATTTCQADGTWSGSVPTCNISQAGFSALVIIGSIYGTFWILAIVLLVIYCTDQKRLPWNLCTGDGLLKNRWIRLLIFISVPFVTFVVAICGFVTKRPGKPTKPVISPKSVSVNVGDKATFTCTSSSTTDQAESGPTMSYTWRRNGEDMKSEGPYMVCGQTLIVTKVVKENAFDTFTCIAREENGPPSDESDSAIIVIIGKPTKPVISLKSVSVNVGDTATCTCTSSSTTYPAQLGLTMCYTWRRNGVDMKSEGRYMVSGQTLTVTKVVKENASDTFTCIAREENGPPSDESDSAIIVIIAKPTWWTKPGNYGKSDQSKPLLKLN